MAIKKIISAQLTLVIVFGLLIALFLSASAEDNLFSGGDGTEDAPYIITTAAELAQLALLINTGDAGYLFRYYILGNDINLSSYGKSFNGGKGWIPIGTSDSSYSLYSNPY